MIPESPFPGYRSLLLIALLPLITAIGPVRAETPWADALPWSYLDTEPALHFLADQFDDSHTGWQIGSLGIGGTALSGETNRLYLRWRYLSFSRGGTRALDRWPELAGDAAGPDWPGEDRGGGWGRPEFGYLGRGRAPLSGPVDYGLTVHLPFSSNALYPYSAQSISLRFALRKSLAVSETLHLAVRGGLLRNLGGAGDDLADEAFPKTTFWGFDLNRIWAGGQVLALDFTASGSDNSESRVLSAGIGWPIGASQKLEMGIARDFADRDDRFYATRIFLRMSVPLVSTGADDEIKDKPDRPIKAGPDDGRDDTAAEESR